ncbi:Receptor-type guanylate cyclase gcy-28, partial [Araneus ventricosus]
MLAGYELGMENGEYAFLSIELLKNQLHSEQFNWYTPNDKKNKEARKMYESLMIISIRVPVREEYQIFINDVKEIAKNKFSSILESSSINPIVGSFYDCVLLYAYSLNKTLSEVEIKEILSMARQIWNSTFQWAGDISINENGDREADSKIRKL